MDERKRRRPKKKPGDKALEHQYDLPPEEADPLSKEETIYVEDDSHKSLILSLIKIDIRRIVMSGSKSTVFGNALSSHYRPIILVDRDKLRDFKTFAIENNLTEIKSHEKFSIYSMKASDKLVKVITITKDVDEWPGTHSRSKKERKKHAARRVLEKSKFSGTDEGKLLKMTLECSYPENFYG